MSWNSRGSLARAAGGRRKWTVAGDAAVLAPPGSGVFVSQPPKWLEDLKLFATGWVGGLIFFGTLFG